MKFDNLDIASKARVWNKLVHYADRLDETRSKISFAEGYIQELKPDADGVKDSVLGTFFFFGVFLFFYIPFMDALFEPENPLRKDNKALFVIICCAIAAAVFILIWLLASTVFGFTEGKHARKKIRNFEKQLTEYRIEENNILTVVEKMCIGYEIPVEAVRLEGLHYAKKLVKEKTFHIEMHLHCLLKIGKGYPLLSDIN